MHELGMAKDLWNVINIKVNENKLKKITKVSIILGEASGIEEDFLRHSLLEHVFPGTIARKAKLEIIKERLSAKCNLCNRKIIKENLLDFSCPKCRSTDLAIISGREVFVKNIEGVK
ncbi:MAG: hydrogenase maturation nickel metallochaperone HypA [Elusimicrobia bacterium]|nr:hydrogenase maturation nickel metallochaperone HypA [Candidatus Liberimonas magnetica]